MRSKKSIFIVLVLVWCLPVAGQSSSCLDSFRDFATLKLSVNPNTNTEAYGITWYGTCILVGSSGGLWLYDPEQPGEAIQIVQIKGSAVTNVAVNPENLTIAFNIAQESTVYFIAPDTGEVTSISADGQAITNISYLHGGSLIAVASSDIADYDIGGLYYNARVQIWNRDQRLIAFLSSNKDVVTGIYITSDEQHVLTDGANPGYDGHIVEYWDLNTGSLLWDYNDLLRDLNPWMENDPLLIVAVAAQGQITALGGLDGYHDWDDYYGTAVHIWDIDSQRRIQEIIISRRGLGNDDDYLTSLALNPNGEILVTAQNNGFVRLWNILDGSLIRESNLHTNKIYQLAFSPDGQLLGMIANGKILIADVKSLEIIASLELFGAIS